jgi:thioredoxin reductase (NADPH)
MSKMYDIAIIGGGPAGLTAAMYAARAGKSVVVYNDPETPMGGQITAAPRIENYPAVRKISGTEFAENLVSQVSYYGAEMVLARVDSLTRLPNGAFRLSISDDSECEAKAVVLATGNRHRRLDVPGEAELIGNGISFCALCDGAFYSDEEVSVIGGGNTALQEALYLADICETVTMIVRRGEFRGDAALVEKVMETKNISILFNEKPVAFELDDDNNIQITLQHAETGKKTTHTTVAVFEACGFLPQIAAPLFNGFASYTDAGAVSPSVPGVFLAGDVIDKEVRQLATAIGDGALAGVRASDYASNFVEGGGQA